ncbi:hypothetical protein [Pseudalkalibacillus hwajinpoensis]|uniref:Uncharacterized protein n=1 Tax=Guptibacillus hwajinpoensis TaxID=208199 RepID=A0A4U1MEG8_9BACL|nr:hypothetical protein [Pseudalkalibacillus hwajinpoensis]TKD68765.1 hypothetical protein FBF83_16325 [Pseudalkalibacillus hwajinpoensis]
METSTMLTEIRTTLTEWVGGHLIIEKKEQDDVDKIIMKIDDFAFLHRGKTVDDYTASTLLQLKGEGKVISDEATVPLPHSLFEIPLENINEVNHQTNELMIGSSRASYHISYNPN